MFQRWCVGVVCFVIACGSDDSGVSGGASAAEKALGKRPAKTTVAPAAKSIGQVDIAALQAVYQRFPGELQASAHSEDPKEFSARIDWNQLLATALSGADLPDKVRDKLVKDYLSQTAETGGAFAFAVVEDTSAGGRYDFVHWHQVAGRLRALFRLTGIDGALDYHDVVVELQSDGKVRATDFYLMSAGESLSEAVRRAIVALAVKEDRGSAARLSGIDRAFATNAEIWQALTRAVDEQKPDDVLAHYAKLPPELKSSKHVLLLRLKAAQTHNEKAAALAMSDYRKAFPNDSSPDLVSIGWHAARKDFVEARAAVARVEKAIEGDPYLNTVRAKLLLEEGKTDEARKLLEKTIAATPDVENAYWGLAELRVAAGDFDETARLLSILAANFGVDLSTLPDVPGYAEFVKSAQYRTLLKKSQK